MATTLSNRLAASPEPMPGWQRPHPHASAHAQGDSLVLYGTAALLLFGPAAFGAVEPWSMFVLQGGSAILLLFWIFRQVSQGEIDVCGNRLFLPMAGFGVCVLLQVLLGTTAYRQRTISSALLYAAYGFLGFLIAQTLRRTRQVKVLAIVFSAYGFLMACFAVAQSMSSNGKLYWVRTPAFGGWIYGPYVNHNHYAGLMEMLFPIPLVVAALRRISPLQKVLASLAAAIMFSSIFFSGSRGGMAACSIELALFAALLFRQRQKRRIALAAGAFLILVAGLVSWLGGGEVSKRVASISRETHAELAGGVRMAINGDGLRMFAQRPLLGWGLGNFSTVYPKYRSFYTNFFINQAHDDYLQCLIETGAVGFALMLWLLVATYRGAVKKLENWQVDTNASVALVTMIGVTGILIHSFVDFNLQVPANAALFYVLCVMAAMEPRFGTARRHSRRTDVIEAVPN